MYCFKRLHNIEYRDIVIFGSLNERLDNFTGGKTINFKEHFVPFAAKLGNEKHLVAIQTHLLSLCQLQ